MLFKMWYVNNILQFFWRDSFFRLKGSIVGSKPHTLLPEKLKLFYQKKIEALVLVFNLPIAAYVLTVFVQTKLFHKLKTIAEPAVGPSLWNRGFQPTHLLIKFGHNCSNNYLSLPYNLEYMVFERTNSGMNIVKTIFFRETTIYFCFCL